MKKIERILVESKPVTAVREKSKRLFIPGFQGLHLYEVWRFFIEQIKREGLNTRAAAISFNVIMAIPAACLFLFTLIPYFPVAKSIHNELIGVIANISPNEDTKKVISDFLDDFFNKPKTGLLLLGFLLALFYTSNAMMGIIRSFDRSLMNRAKPKFLEKRLRAIKLTLILVILFIGTAIISAGQGALFNFIMEKLSIKNDSTKALIQSLRWVVVVALFLYAVAFIYKFAPSVHKRWKLLSPGAILATFLMILATWLFSLWAQNFSNYNKFYGSIGSLLIIMTLIFINSLILLIGYELNVSISYLKQQIEKRKLKDSIN